MKVSSPHTSQLVQNRTTSLTKMIRNISLILLAIKVTLLVNTGAQNECFRGIELELEIRSALTTINGRLDSLETNLKKEVKEAKELTLNQDDKFKIELVKIKEEIIAETERLLPYPQLTGIKNDVKISTEIVTGKGNVSTTLPSDCKEVQNRGYNSSGPYRIHPKLAKYPFLVWCDMKTEKGGWTYILNRFDGSQTFYLNWTDYRRGFGNISGEHWLGLEHMYELTNSKSYQLFIELVDWKSIKGQAFYSNFKIGNELKNYPVKSLGKFRGNIGDSFAPHLGVKFSTPDRDNDVNPDEESCAQYFKTGWWFHDCHQALLTGQYISNPLPGGNYYYQSSIKWEAFHGYNYSLKETRMMIRPV